MKDNEITSFDKELNKFLQPKCLIPGGLGLWETYFRKICTALKKYKIKIKTSFKNK